MALLPPEDEYQQRVKSAWMNHVAKGLRSAMQDDQIPDSASDEDVVHYYRDKYAAGAQPGEFDQYLQDTYGQGYKAPEKTLGENVGGVVRGFAKAAPSIGRQVAWQGGAETIAGLAGKTAAHVGAPVMGGLYLARSLRQAYTGHELSQIADAMPEPNVPALQRHYFDSLSPGMTAKGYSADQIGAEVERRVRNVVRGYTTTQNSLMGDIQTTSQDMISTAGEGIANIGLLGVGGGFFKNALEAGAKRLAGERAAQKITTTLAGRLVTHGAVGAGLGAGYGATTGAFEGGGAAAQEGKSVLMGAAKGAIAGATSGAVGGAALGAPLGAAFDAVGKKAVIDAAISTPKPPPSQAMGAAEIPAGKPPLQITGAQPGVHEPELGSQEWWEQQHGVEKPTSPLQSPLGATSPAEEFAPRLPAPSSGPRLEGPPRGRVEPLELSPATKPPVIKGTNPNDHVRSVASDYNSSANLPPPSMGEYHPFDANKARQIAAAYDALPKVPKPEDEAATKQSYDALNSEIDAQYKALQKAGYSFEFTKDDPYKSSAEMQDDLKNNKHLRIFAATDEHHPFMSADETNKFRAVHDAFGHGSEGFQFGPRGEDNAWRKHAQMFSDEAIPALTTETRGQNSWVNYAPGHEDLAQSERPFAEQKAGLLPPWTYEDAMNREAPARSEAVEPHMLSLPSAPVEQITNAVKKADGTIEGAKVSVRSSVDGRRLVIDSIKGAEHGAGASGKALDRLIATADKTSVPIDVTVADYKGARGGTIPAEKVAQWYERRGFKRVNETPGAISLHRPVPDPEPPLTSEQIGALAEHHVLGPEGIAKADEASQLDAFMKRAEGLSENKAQEALGNIEEGKPMIRGQGASGQPSVGMRLGSWLDSQAAAADERIQSKIGRLTSGFDPSLIGDYAIKAAAKMYRLGYTAYTSLRAEMLKEHPGIPSPAMKDIISQARDIIQNRLQGDNISVTKLTRLLEAAEEGRPGANWYDQTSNAVQKMFGADGDMFTRFLAATSAGKAADANVTMAMKAYGQWKLGLPFDGFMANDRTMLEKASRGEVFGERKLQSILGALRGDENAVAIDRHVMRALGFEKAGAEKGNLTDREYEFFEAVIRDLAQGRGMTPRQFQASLWTSSKIRQAQSATTPKEMSYLHSFRPYEGILQYEHDIAEGRKTPLDWVNENRVTLQHLANASEGVGKTRNGDGFTYSPYDYSAYKANHGIVTTLASVRIPTDKLTAAEVMGFTQKWKKLISSYYGMNTGSFNLDQAGEKGLSSLDLNVVMPEAMRDRALELAKSRRQRSVWDLGKGESIETGYNGETMDAPANPKERGQWWKKQHDEIDRLMQQIGVPSRSLRQVDMFQEPVHRVTSGDQYWGLEAETAMPKDVHEKLEAAKTPEELNSIIAENEKPLAASLKQAGLAQDAESLKYDGSATDLLRYYLRKKEIPHDIVQGKSDIGSTRVWVRTKDGAELDPSGEGMKDGVLVKDTDEPELKRGQIEAMLRAPHRWHEYVAQALGIEEDQVKKLVDDGKVHPISDAGMLDHVEVHKDGTVWEYVDPTAPSYNIMKLVGMLKGKRAPETLAYLEGKSILSGHDVVQDYRSQAGYIRTDSPSKVAAFARRAPISKINSAMVAANGQYVNPNIFRYTHPQGVSIWVSPDGKVIQIPFHLRNAATVIKKLGLKNPVRYEGPEHDALQLMLNHGYVRVQMHDQSYAADSTVPLTSGQVMALREFSRGANGRRKFAGRLTQPNGEHRALIDDYMMGSGALNKYITESRGE